MTGLPENEEESGGPDFGGRASRIGLRTLASAQAPLFG